MSSLSFSSRHPEGEPLAAVNPGAGLLVNAAPLGPEPGGEFDDRHHAVLSRDASPAMYAPRSSSSPYCVASASDKPPLEWMNATMVAGSETPKMPFNPKA